jgi:purine-binding chemotaxis protein CheW
VSETVVQLVVFQVAGEEYALPVQVVREVARGGALLPLRSSRGAGAAVGMLQVAGSTVPVIEARERLGVPAASQHSATRHVIVFQHGGGLRVGLAVDAVREVVTVEPQTLLAPPAIYEGRSAAVRALVRLEGERLVMMLEPDALLDPGEVATLAGAEVDDQGEQETGTLHGDS